MNTEKRLARLEVVWRRRERPAEDAGTPFDAGRLTMREQYELDGLLALIEPAGRRGRADFAALDDDALERLVDLDQKAHGIPPAPPYYGMTHRPAEIGACACLGCASYPRPNARDFVGGTT